VVLDGGCAALAPPYSVVSSKVLGSSEQDADPGPRGLGEHRLLLAADLDELGHGLRHSIKQGRDRPGVGNLDLYGRHSGHVRLLGDTIEGMSGKQPGKRLGQMMATEPELTEVQVDDAGHEFTRRFVDYLTADGFGVGSMVTRMERLKFETIVTGKSYREVLTEAEES
jgi:hypothetical protein